MGNAGLSKVALAGTIAPDGVVRDRLFRRSTSARMKR